MFLEAVQRNESLDARRGIRNIRGLQKLGNEAGAAAQTKTLDWIVGGLLSGLKATMDKNSEKMEEVVRTLEVKL
jgi:hypothetical protein